MKGKTCISENLILAKASMRKAASLLRTEMSVFHQGTEGKILQQDAGYMAATIPSCSQHFSLANQGRTIYARTEGTWQARKHIGGDSSIHTPQIAAPPRP